MFKSIYAYLFEWLESEVPWRLEFWVLIFWMLVLFWEAMDTIVGEHEW